ncbi:hypothetical protein CYMTET_16363 [Cymbomonas tetramitiformis]|uniref:Uncharacterized protein n=1 Tax=Cymbomonas tetramitiformis TaxID=36881 RepID=A0AAE0GDK5_9CHLO|nr:hypothetical protein CYMTET_16362 [Cymbomonas tetramitiformis]KAK3275511.1 hypothetical protein CYMTET_16363 [Cymbomonas tetramitiformis]
MVHMITATAAVSELGTKWRTLASDRSLRTGAWAEGPGERLGQICDPWRGPGDTDFSADDALEGCVVVWYSAAHDNFTVADLPLDQQNNFQNTQHYKVAWNYHQSGMKATSLPRPAEDIDPVCYVVNHEGNITLGYEEGNGDRLLPCPGARGGAPFTEQQILGASDAELQDFCTQCYQGVCTRQRSTNPRNCGGDREGGVEVGAGDEDDDIVQMVRQVDSAYHCHLTMADEGACDYVQYNQHEASRAYNMSSGVLCGWEQIRVLNITYCDCTIARDRANSCNRNECLRMATNGVVCGNCGGCDQNAAYEQIFGAVGEFGASPYAGVCAMASEAPTSEEREEAKMLCSQGLFCRSSNLGSSGCVFHCERFPEDPKCTAADEVSDKSARKLLELAGFEESDAATLSAEDDTPSERAATVTSFRGTKMLF